ncbi:MAG: helix-turn-helix domain-containing protein [Rhodoferax sp.]|nr:helix-turn-helix domain-containing protein [Rhodoferax sp.]
MTDYFQVPDSAAVTEPPVVLAASVGPGAMLRQAREAADLHIAALAVTMKVPVRKLQALEAENFVELGDPVYVRAFAASMCRALKMDAEPILRKLPKTLPLRLDVKERGINRSFQTPGAISRRAIAGFVTRPAVLLSLVLLVGAGVLLLLPGFTSQLAEATSAKAKPAAMDETALQTVKLETFPEASPDAHAKSKPAAPTSPPAASTKVAQSANPAQAASAAPPPAPAGPALVRFEVSATSWVRVADGSGKVQLEKTLSAGETGEAGGQLPLSVVVGNVAATTVQVRGQTWSMDGFAKENVARFEVK